MDVVIVIPKGSLNVLALSGITYLFETSNRYRPFFEIKVASAEKRKQLRSGRFCIEVDQNITAIQRADLILIPSIVGDGKLAVQQNQPLIDWLLEMYRSGAQLGSMCTGAWLLAASGLLDGKQASSHWGDIHDLKLTYPAVKWVPEKIITYAERIYTSGGTLSSFNLIVYIIEKYLGKKTAIDIAKLFQIDYPRRSQSPFFIFSNQKRHQDEAILRVQQYIETHLAHGLTVDQLAQQFSMSRRNLIRRFKAATGNTPKYYIQRVKMEEAKRLLETQQYSVVDTMHKVGYNDMNSFRRVFLRLTGHLPSRYRRMYAKY